MYIRQVTKYDVYAERALHFTAYVAPLSITQIHTNGRFKIAFFYLLLFPHFICHIIVYTVNLPLLAVGYYTIRQIRIRI
jgi:hypothetical protein